MRDQQAAQSFADQAVVAKQKREELRIAAEAAFQAAQEAAAAAAAAVAAEEENKRRLEVQIQVLEEDLLITEAQYQEGERIRNARRRPAGRLPRRRTTPRRRSAACGRGRRRSLRPGRLAQNAREQLRRWRRRSPRLERLGPPRLRLDLRPTTATASTPSTDTYRLHTGTDVAASCGQPIAAAAGGTVIYAGWNGTYGNFVMINHGNGLTTGYAHILRPAASCVGSGQ